MQKYVAPAVGILFGGVFVMSAVVVLFHLAPMPEIPPETPAGKFFGAFGPTGYLTFVKVLELAGGVIVMVPPRSRRSTGWSTRPHTWIGRGCS